MNAFEKTLSFSDKLRKPAHKIIGWCFAKGFIAKVQVQSLNDMALDQRAGIDSKVVFEQSQVSFSIQEKYRTNDNLKYMDFTQELYNAYGTEHQTDGEFQHLWASYYFYGWANEDETGFSEWFIMDIQEYKKLVLQVGGLDKIPNVKKIQNQQYGKALFFTIPLEFIKPAIMWASHKLAKQLNG